MTQGTTWSLTGSGTAGPKNNYLTFGGGVSFVNQTTTTIQAITTEPNIGSTTDGSTLNTASWTYDSWNFVNATIRPGNHACGGGGLQVDKALPDIIYGGPFNITQTWVWQAQPSVREQFAAGGLPVQVTNSMLLGWTFYNGGLRCGAGVGPYELPSGALTSVVGQSPSAGLTFDAGCDTATPFGTIPLGHGGEGQAFPGVPFYNPGPQNNDDGNPGEPNQFPIWQISLPFAPYVTAPTVSGLTPTSGPAGTEVTITGSGFEGATGVFFGGVAATAFTVVSDATITAIAPAQQEGVTSAIVDVQNVVGITAGPTFTYSD